ncbi:MAG TPA: hypothetical protein PKK43_03845 [Spirochaetota bacterium]|nr:hypothetical protein [Spirochaetota bacterium]
MIRHFITTLFLLFALISSSAPVHAHYLIFLPSSGKTFSPTAFLSDTRDAFIRYKKDKGRFPASWKEALPYIAKDPAYSFLSDKTSGITKDNVLTIKDKDMKKPCRIIMDSSADAFSIHTEGAEKDNDYKVMHDTEKVMWYFRSEKDELARISEVEKDYREDTLVRKFLGQGDPLHIRSWRFDHPAAFDLLLRFLSESRLEYYTKIAVLCAVRDTPHLSRYRHRFTALERILTKEMKRKVKSDDRYRKEYIDLFNEILREIN